MGYIKLNCEQIHKFLEAVVDGLKVIEDSGNKYYSMSQDGGTGSIVGFFYTDMSITVSYKPPDEDENDLPYRGEVLIEADLFGLYQSIKLSITYGHEDPNYKLASKDSVACIYCFDEYLYSAQDAGFGYVFYPNYNSTKVLKFGTKYHHSYYPESFDSEYDYSDENAPEKTLCSKIYEKGKGWASSCSFRFLPKFVPTKVYRTPRIVCPHESSNPDSCMGWDPIPRPETPSLDE